MMNRRYTFTVFTPAFNRARTLYRVFESLMAQTFRDFEWLVADDGSTDGSAALIENWKKEAWFPVRYFWQENMGKNMAFNRGVMEAQGEFFLTLDSDDECVPRALERFKYHWDSIPEDMKERFSAVTALCVDQNGAMVGGRFPEDVFDSDSLEMVYRYGIKGEKWGFQKTDILREYPFPQIKGGRYIPESVVWSRIAARYKTRFVNEPLRIYWTDEPGAQEEKITKPGSPAKYAAGHAYWHNMILNNETGWFFYRPSAFFLSAAHYARFSFHTGAGLARQAGALENLPARLLWAVMAPAGYLAYLADLWRHGRG